MLFDGGGDDDEDGDDDEYRDDALPPFSLNKPSTVFLYERMLSRVSFSTKSRVTFSL